MTCPAGRGCRFAGQPSSFRSRHRETSTLGPKEEKPHTLLLLIPAIHLPQATYRLAAAAAAAPYGYERRLGVDYREVCAGYMRRVRFSAPEHRNPLGAPSLSGEFQ